MVWSVRHDLTTQAQIHYSRNSVNFWLPGRQIIEMVRPQEACSRNCFRWGYGPSRDWNALALLAMEVRQRVAMMAVLTDSLNPIQWHDGADFPKPNQWPRVNQFAEGILSEFTDGKFVVYCREDMTVEENATGGLRLVDDYAIVVAPRTITIESLKGVNPSEPIPS